MFAKILHASDGSEHAFNALTVAIALAKQNGSELHMISVEEIDYMLEFLEEVREEVKKLRDDAFTPSNSAPAPWPSVAGSISTPMSSLAIPCATSCFSQRSLGSSFRSSARRAIPQSMNG